MEDQDDKIERGVAIVKAFSTWGMPSGFFAHYDMDAATASRQKPPCNDLESRINHPDDLLTSWQDKALAAGWKIKKK